MKNLVAVFFAGVVCLLTTRGYADIELAEKVREVEKDNTKLLQIPLAGEGTWTASTTDTDMITRISPTSGDHTKNLYFKLSPNLSTEPRTGVVKVNGQDYTIIQKGYDAVLSSNEIVMPAVVGSEPLSIDFTVQEAPVGSEISWAASSPVDWIVLTPDAGSVWTPWTGSVQCQLSPNEAEQERSAVVSIAGKTCVITQKGREPSTDVVVAPTYLTVESSANSVKIHVMANAVVSWTVVSDSPWIVIDQSAAGMGSSTVEVRIEKNESVLARTGHVSVGQQEVTVVQKGTKEFNLKIEPAEMDISYSSAMTSVVVQATDGLPWSVKSKSDWIAFPAAKKGQGTCELQLQVGRNNDLLTRTGVVEIAAQIPYPEIDLSRGLSQWEGVNWNYERVRHYDDWHYVPPRYGDPLPNFSVDCKDTRVRDPSVTGWTEGVWFCIKMDDMTHRLFDLNGGECSVYVLDNRLVFQDSKDEIFDLNFPIVRNTDYALFFASSPTNTMIYGGHYTPSATKGSYLPLLTVETALKVTSYGFATKPSPEALKWGTSCTNACYYWNRTLNAQEMRDFSFHMPSVTLPSYAVLRSLYSVAPMDRFKNVFNTENARWKDCLNSQMSSRAGLLQNENWLQCSNGFLTEGKEGLSQNAISADVIEAMPAGMQQMKDLGYWAVGRRGYNSIIECWEMEDYFADLHQTTWVEGLWGATTYSSFTFNVWLKFQHREDEVKDLLIFPRGQNTVVWGDRLATVAPKDKYKIQYSARGIRFVENSQISEDFGGAEIEDDEWHMLTFASNGSRLTLYVDGVDVGNIAIQGDYKGFYPDLWVAYGHKGEVIYDELKTYTCCFTVSDVRNIYEHERPLAKTLHIVQSAAEPSVSPSLVEDVPSRGGEYEFTLTLPSRVRWMAESQCPAWLSVVSDTNGTGTATIRVAVGKNVETYPREGSVVIAGMPVTIRQKGTGISLPDGDIYFAAFDGSTVLDIRVQTDDPATHWTVIDDPDNGFFADPLEGYGNGTVSVEVGECLMEMFSQMGKISISGKDVYIVQRDFDLTVNPPFSNCRSLETSGQVQVLTEEGEGSWGAVSDVPWLTITGKDYGNGDGTIDYKVSENTSGAVRVGRIIVAGETCVITQGVPGVAVGIRIVGEDSVLAGGSTTCRGELMYSDGVVEQVSVNWEMADERLGHISSGGVFSAGLSAGIAVVNASYEKDGARFLADKQIEVLAKPKALRMEIKESVVCCSESVKVVGYVTYADGIEQEVYPSVTVMSGDATFSAPYTLSVGKTPGEIRLAASYVENEVEVIANLTTTARIGISMTEALGSDCQFDKEWWPDKESWPWRPETEDSHDGTFSMKTMGRRPNVTMSDLTTTVEGAGTISFWMKTSPTGQATGVLSVDNQVAASVCEVSEWTNVVCHIDTWGSHRLCWYAENEEDDEYCVWLDEVKWMPDAVKPVKISIIGQSWMLTNSTNEYSCEVSYNNGTVSETSHVWSVVSGSDLATFIGKTGFLRSYAMGGRVTIRASVASGDSELATEKAIDIVPRVVGLEIAGPTEVSYGSSAVFRYQCRATYSDGSTKDVQPSWSAGGRSISADGVLTAVCAEQLQIEASYEENGVRVSATPFPVTVKSAIADLKIDGPDSIVNSTGVTAAYSCVVTRADGTAETVAPKWEVVRGDATVGEDGQLVPGTPGMVSLKATYSFAGVTREFTKEIAVRRVLASIEVSGPDSLKSTETGHYVCTAVYGDDSRRVVEPSWEVTAGLVSIEADGTVTPQKKSGGIYTQILATYVEGGVKKYGTKIIAITHELASIEIDGPDVVKVGASTSYRVLLNYDDERTAAGENPTWKVTKGQATIDAEGYLSSAVVGEVEIQASYTYQGVTKTTTKIVKVNKELVSVSIAGPQDVAAHEKPTYHCQAAYSDGSVADVNAQWESSAGVVSEQGVLDPMGAEQITLTATYEEGDVRKSASVQVLVRPWVALVAANLSDVNDADKLAVTSIVVKASMGEVPAYLFKDWSNVVSVVVEDGVTSVGEGAFRDMAALREVDLPGSIGTLRYRTFSQDHALERVRLGEGLKHIGSTVFLNCDNLKDVRIPNSVVDMDESVFGWSGVTNVVLGTGLVSLKRTFASCWKLQSVTFEGNAPSCSGDDFFLGTPETATIYVKPWSTGWSEPGSTALPEKWPVGNSSPRTIRWKNEPEGIYVAQGDVTVPVEWVDKYPTIISAFGGDRSKALSSVGANGLPLWQSYVADLDPTNPESKFRAFITIENGVPKVTWDPDIGSVKRTYRTFGTTSLGASAEWDDLTGKSTDGYNFFKVTVELPK